MKAVTGMDNVRIYTPLRVEAGYQWLTVVVSSDTTHKLLGHTHPLYILDRGLLLARLRR